jgi:hypothetical protein
MTTARFTTRFASWSRPQAIALLVVLVIALAVCLLLAVTRPTLSTPGAASQSFDGDLYRAIVERVRAGEGYYDAAGTELRARRYPTGSIFNWRTPLYAWVVGKVPEPLWAQILLWLPAIATLLLAYTEVQREAGMQWGVASLLLLASALSWTVIGEVYLFTELWAGVLIALSVFLYGQGNWPLGLAAGLLALFFRELALLYGLLALLLAVWERRHREVIAWIAGLALYGVYLILHGLQVTERITIADRVHAGGWIQFGGLPFVIGTCQINLVLINLPGWVSAVCLPLSLLGWAGWRGATGWRGGLTVAGYVVAFLVVGNPAFNCYWGLMYAPLFAFGLLGAPVALRDAWAVVSNSGPQVTDSADGDGEKAPELVEAEVG